MDPHPDPHQNVMDPQHWFLDLRFKIKFFVQNTVLREEWWCIRVPAPGAGPPLARGQPPAGRLEPRVAAG